MTMTRRTTLAAIGAVSASTALGGIKAWAEDPKIITLAGAGPQGRWFQEASLFGKILTQNMPGYTVNGVTGKGVSIGNIKRIAAGDLQGGRFYSFDLQQAQAGEGLFTEGDYSDVVVWMKLGTHLFRVVAETDVKNFSQLVGKTVAIGQRGSGDDVMAKLILGAYGVDESNTKFLYEGRETAFAAFINQQIDAIAYFNARNNQGHYGPVFAARDLGSDIDFVIPDPDKNEAFTTQNPIFFVDTLGEPVFGRPDLPGIALYQGMAISKTLSDDLVYQMTDVIYSNWEGITEAAPWWKEKGEASLESASALNDILAYHPGAERYYRDKGVWAS
jgi:uncharacterized protein